jgi:hypothetical protein
LKFRKRQSERRQRAVEWELLAVFPLIRSAWYDEKVGGGDAELNLFKHLPFEHHWGCQLELRGAREMNRKRKMKIKDIRARKSFEIVVAILCCRCWALK